MTARGDRVRRWAVARRDEARLSLMLLSRLPMGTIAVPPPMGAALWAYPLAGLVVGALAGTVFDLGLILGQGRWPAAVLAIAAAVALTGAMHEDGIADLADGAGAGADRTRRLAIMADSRVGSFGALALIVVMLLRAGYWAGLPGPGLAAPVWAAGIAAVARGGLPRFMHLMPSARPQGLGARASQASHAAPVVAALLIGLVAGLVLLPAAVWVIAAIFVMLTLVAGFAHWRLGGLTGDVLGAMVVLGELAGWAALAGAGMLTGAGIPGAG